MYVSFLFFLNFVWCAAIRSIWLSKRWWEMRPFYVQFSNVMWIRITTVRLHYTNYSTVSHHRSTMNSFKQYWILFQFLLVWKFWVSIFHAMHTQTYTQPNCVQIIYFSNVKETLRRRRRDKNWSKYQNENTKKCGYK